LGARLASWGYVALVVDSLRPRGVTTRCNNKGDVSARANLPVESLAGDVRAGAAFLRARADVDAEKVGVLGIDLGASIAVAAAQVKVLDTYRVQPFRALVASSPGDCGIGAGARLASDLLILAGDRDDFDPGASGCRRFGAAVDRNGHVLLIKVYPDAYHLFDAPFPLHLSGDGHMIGRNAAAMADAQDQVRAFLARTMPP
jgi:dienelactone hydrolase